MASRLLNPNLFHLRTPLLLTTLGVSTGLFVHQHTSIRHALRLDSSPSAVSPKDWSFSQYQSDAQTPILTSGGRLNARAVRQMSAGSIFGIHFPPPIARYTSTPADRGGIAGLVAGLGISVFSKPLALLLGLLIVGVQTAESYGIHLVPYGYLQKYVKGINMRSAVQDNAAFKLSFGLMFALSAFAQL